MKCSYLKSWPGLLAGAELILGGMAVACVVAYVQRDGEWTSSYELYYGAYNHSLGSSGYRGPMTPFVLAVAGLSWVMTLVLLVMGAVLLDSPCWLLTEAFANMALVLLCASAGIVYLNDLDRGGLCHTTVGVNPIMADLCRVEEGQIAGAAFIFIDMLMYLASFLVCVKMWRQEVKHRHMEHYRNMCAQTHSKRIVDGWMDERMAFEDEMDIRPREGNRDEMNGCPREGNTHIDGCQRGSNKDEMEGRPRESNKHVTMHPSTTRKCPEIPTTEERERHKAVFYDQYEEFKTLHREISGVLVKFRELDAAMARLPTDCVTTEEQRRIEEVMKIFEQKKSDPFIREKKERYDYLKAKLSI